MTVRAGTEDLTTPERILDVAADQFLQQGYAATPLSAIAAEVGVTKAALYYHFPSKEQILASLVAPLLDRVDALLEGTPRHFTDPESRWRFILDYAAVLDSDPRAVAILGADNQKWLLPELSAKIEVHRRRTIELARFADADDEEKVRAMLAMDIIHRELVLTPDRVDLAEVSRERRRELVLGLARGFLEGRTA